MQDEGGATFHIEGYDHHARNLLRYNSQANALKNLCQQSGTGFCALEYRQAFICTESTDTCDECTGNDDCDDGLFCTGAEACVGGSCQVGTAPNCDDGVGCTDDSCNAGTDSCDNIANNANCDDGLFCNGDESCDATLDCQAGTPPTCDDGLGCTDDSCDVGTDSCENVANDADCSDGLFCNGQESCVDGECMESDLPCDPGRCDEENDVCNPADPEQPQPEPGSTMCGACGPTGPAAIFMLLGLFVFRFIGPRTRGRS